MSNSNVRWPGIPLQVFWVKKGQRCFHTTVDGTLLEQVYTSLWFMVRGRRRCTFSKFTWTLLSGNPRILYPMFRHLMGFRVANWRYPFSPNVPGRRHTARNDLPDCLAPSPFMTYLSTSSLVGRSHGSRG
jgi:hypothetical protein